MLKIDMHTHIMPKNLPRWADKFGYDGFIHLDHHREGYANMMQGEKFFREINENCWDGAVRIKEYQQHETQVQVVCTIPVLFAYFAKPKDGLEVAQFLNDDIANLVAKYPKNYVGLGTIPMQDPELAVQELHRIKEIGLVGIQIGSNVDNKNLNEPEFYPIWEACEKLGLAIFVHPWNMMGKKHMEKYWLPWLVGMPAETARAISSMIFGGIFEKFPKLRVNFGHAGGSFLATIGRIEHGFNCRPDLVAVDNPINPKDYLGKFWVDCITHDPRMLKYVLEVQGSNRVTLGSDYPFPLGDLEIGKFVTEAGLEKPVVDDIFCNSTLEWLNLDKKLFL
ncbi:MAG: amidohydrolase [Flavobacteriales bacterium]|jgi:aminocarboxymuconate-semialdehyde decarboxylase|nr:amidohydrolase [Flavobacteriales bacterium]